MGIFDFLIVKRVIGDERRREDIPTRPPPRHLSTPSGAYNEQARKYEKYIKERK